MDATAAITLAAGDEGLSDTLDVKFGKRPGAVVLPNRSAGDAFVWYSKPFKLLVSICHSVVRYCKHLCLAGWEWSRGSKEEKVIRYWLTLVSGLGTSYTWLGHDLARLRMDGPITRPNRCSTWEEINHFFFWFQGCYRFLTCYPDVLYNCRVVRNGNPFATSWTFILCSVVFQLLFYIIKAIL